jgi:hypothetical protein
VYAVGSSLSQKGCGDAIPTRPWGQKCRGATLMFKSRDELLTALEVRSARPESEPIEEYS